MTKTNKSADVPKPSNSASTTKLNLLLAELGRAGGATVDEMATATGWQKHSVRGAMAGSLKKKGHTIASEKTDGVRRYRLETTA